MMSFGYSTLLFVFGIVSQVCGQTAVVSGTNFVNGSGLCFGDQQMKEGTPFIVCTPSGFPPDAVNYGILWTLDGSQLGLGAVNSMYPDRIDALDSQAGVFRLNILNVTSFGVSSVACSISALNSSFVQVGVTPTSAPENISVVNAVPAPEMPRVTPSNTSVEVTVSKPSGLCEGLRSSQITYEFKVYRSNSLVTTENVTTSGPTATANVSGLNSGTEYRVEIQGIINVVSQSMPVSMTFNTSGPRTTASPPTNSALSGAAVGGALGGLVLVILIAVVM